MAQLCDGILPGPQHLEQSGTKDDVDEQPVSFSKLKDLRTENARINEAGSLD